jgi:hypothetical protein
VRPWFVFGFCRAAQRRRQQMISPVRNRSILYESLACWNQRCGVMDAAGSMARHEEAASGVSERADTTIAGDCEQAARGDGEAAWRVCPLRIAEL